MDADDGGEWGTALCDAGLPAATEMQPLMVSRARMQSRPSDSSEQKVGRRHVSGRGSPRAFVRRRWQKEGWRGLAPLYSGTICKPDCWSQAKKLTNSWSPAVIDKCGPPRTSFWYEWRQKWDNVLWVVNVTVIKWRQWANALSSAGDAQCQKEGQHPLLINIFITTATICSRVIISRVCFNDQI